MKRQKLNTLSLRQNSKRDASIPTASAVPASVDQTAPSTGPESRPATAKPELLRFRYLRVTSGGGVSGPVASVAPEPGAEPVETLRTSRHYSSWRLIRSARSKPPATRNGPETSPSRTPALSVTRQAVNVPREAVPAAIRPPCTPGFERKLPRLSSGGLETSGTLRKGILNPSPARTPSAGHTRPMGRLATGEVEVKKKVTFKDEPSELVISNAAPAATVRQEAAGPAIHLQRTSTGQNSSASRVRPELLSDEPLILSQRNLELHNIVLNRRREIPLLVDLPDRSMTAVDKAAYCKVVDWLDRYDAALISPSS